MSFPYLTGPFKPRSWTEIRDMIIRMEDDLSWMYEHCTHSGTRCELHFAGAAPILQWALGADWANDGLGAFEECLESRSVAELIEAEKTLCDMRWYASYRTLRRNIKRGRCRVVGNEIDYDYRIIQPAIWERAQDVARRIEAQVGRNKLGKRPDQVELERLLGKHFTIKWLLGREWGEDAKMPQFKPDEEWRWRVEERMRPNWPLSDKLTQVCEKVRHLMTEVGLGHWDLRFNHGPYVGQCFFPITDGGHTLKPGRFELCIRFVEITPVDEIVARSRFEFVLAGAIAGNGMGVATDSDYTPYCT